MITDNDVMDWFSTALAGAELVYFELELPKGSTKHWALPKNSAVVAVRRLYNEGLVDLYQRREESGFSYIVFKRLRCDRPKEQFSDVQLMVGPEKEMEDAA